MFDKRQHSGHGSHGAHQVSPDFTALGSEAKMDGLRGADPSVSADDPVFQ